MRTIHEHDPYFRLHCNLYGCPKVYHKVDSLLHHRRKIHRTVSDCDFFVADHLNANQVSDADSMSLNDASPNSPPSQPLPSGQVQQYPPTIDEAAFARQCGMFLLAMKEKHKLPEKVISEIAAECQTLMQLTHVVTLDKVKLIWNASYVSTPVIADLHDRLNGISPLTNSLSAVGTSIRRQRF